MDDGKGEVEVSPETLHGIYEKRQAAGKRSPLDECPGIPDWLVWVYLAFVELSDDRRYDQGNPLPITTWEIVSWSIVPGLDRSELGYLKRIVKRVDSAYLKWVRERRRKIGKSKPGGKSRGRGARQSGTRSRRSPPQARGGIGRKGGR